MGRGGRGGRGGGGGRGGHGGYEYKQLQEDQLMDGAEVMEKVGFKIQYLLLGLTLVDLLVWTLGFLAVVDFKLDNLLDEYSIFHSLMDVWIFGVARAIFTIAGFCKFQLFFFSFWFNFNAFLLLIGKIIIWENWTGDWHQHADDILLLSSFILCLGELLIVASIRATALIPVVVKDGETKEVPSLSFMQLLGVLKPYFAPDGLCNRLRVVFTWLCLIFSKVCNILSPLYIGKATNKINNGEIPTKEIIAYVALSWAASSFKELQNVIYLTVKQTAFRQLSGSTFAHLHSLSLDWHLQKHMGSVLRSMDRGISSADSVVSYLFLYLVPSLAECVVVFVIFYVHFDQPWLTIIAFLCFSWYIVATVKLTLWRKQFRKATNKFDNDFHDQATDSLINFETVKYFANEEYEIDRYTKSVTQYQKFSVATQASLSVLNVTQKTLVNICLGLCLSVAGYEIVQKEAMDIGSFVTINVYLLNLFTPLNFLGSIYNAIIQAFVDMQNLSELLAVPKDVKDVENAPDLQRKSQSHNVHLEFQNVYFRYPSQPEGQGLRGISFTVPPGTTTAIVGTTGAGKTTIGRLLFRFYDVLQGQILVDGQDISQVTQKSLRELIGVVPQDTVMFNDTIRHNIQYGRLGAKQEELDAAAKAAQILPFITGKLKEGWETTVGERGLKLSGGEKQRVAIARALLKDPPLVLLDEATSALDSVTEKEIQTALIQLGVNRTTLIIAHRLSTIRHADQIIVLEDGQIAERGSHEQLLKTEGRYARMWNMQLEELEQLSQEQKAAAAEEKKEKKEVQVKDGKISEREQGKEKEKEEKEEDGGDNPAPVNTSQRE